jgi:ABC-2 type transport system ATP-binding protein
VTDLDSEVGRALETKVRQAGTRVRVGCLAKAVTPGRVVEGPIRGYLWGKKPGRPRKIAMQKETPKGEDRTPVLTVKNVSYYYGSKQALDDVSFEVFPGRVTALLGPNGAGKTTLFSLITRLFDAPTGRIEIVGRSAAELGSRALEPLGVVFQQPTLDLDLTVKQNLRYFAALRGLARKDADERMMRALDALDMAERLNERVRDLNGGHRRRVEIARGILHSPKLLLLDEPTIGLDVPTRTAIVRHIHELARADNIGVLWATHLFDEVEPDDDLLVLNKGRIVARGVAQDVVAETGAGNLGGAFRLLIGGDTEEDITA